MYYIIVIYLEALYSKCFNIAVIYVSDLRELHLGRSAYIFSIFCNSLFWNVPIPE
jgi:hypothetical protein